jgi:hypothetical protein
VGSAHLAKRFFGSLRPGGPKRSHDVWGGAQLLPGEVELWSKMPNPDRRHAVGVAHEVLRSLGHEATRPVLAAALLHDVGKTVSGLRTFGRVAATLAGMAAGRARAVTWTEGRGFTRKVGLYLEHPRLGGDLLAMAGTDPFTEAWAREHHLPPDQWTLDPHLAGALKAADDD